MKHLILILKSKWFEMWRSGIKKEDYRDIKPYWAKRFCKNYCMECNINLFNEIIPIHCEECDYFQPKLYDSLILKNGYCKSDDSKRIIRKQKPIITIGKGNADWGAVKDKFYFKIIGW